MFKSARASKISKRTDPMPEDIGAATHEPWGINMPPAASHSSMPPYGVEPPKWANTSLRPSNSPHHAPGVYVPPHNPYPTPRSSYESADYSPRPLSSHQPQMGHYPPPIAAHPSHPPPPPGQLPTLHDSGLAMYRDPSPYTQSSSSSSEPGTSPRTFSSPLTPPSSTSLPLSIKNEKQQAMPHVPTLVPLSYLQGLQSQGRQQRDPMDVLYLQRFSTPDKEPNRHSWASTPPYDRFGEEEAKPTLVDSRW